MQQCTDWCGCPLASHQLCSTLCTCSVVSLTLTIMPCSHALYRCLLYILLCLFYLFVLICILEVCVPQTVCLTYFAIVLELVSAALPSRCHCKSSEVKFKKPSPLGSGVGVLTNWALDQWKELFVYKLTVHSLVARRQQSGCAQQ